LVLSKLAGVGRLPWTYDSLAHELGLSVSAVHRSVDRAAEALGDLVFRSHDFEDLITLVDRREELIGEVHAAPATQERFERIVKPRLEAIADPA
jgi:hypothetical protein